MTPKDVWYMTVREPSSFDGSIEMSRLRPQPTQAN